MAIEILSQDDFQKRLREAGNKLVVVDFHATWCGPCRQIEPALRKFAEETFKDVCFLKVDVDDNVELAEAYEIEAMPTFMFFRNGAPCKDDSFTGSNAIKLEEKIREHLL